MASEQSSRTGSTREQVVAHAAALIRERGFRATSIGDVLERAGIQKGSFYYHFPSKEDLGHAVIDRWLADQRERLLDYLAAADGPPPLERPAAVLDGFLAEQDTNGCRGGCAFGNLAAELSDVHEGFRLRLREAFTLFRKGFAGLLERARARGDVRDDLDIPAMADFLVASIEGGVLLAKVEKRTEPLANVLRMAEAHLASYRTRA